MQSNPKEVIASIIDQYENYSSKMRGCAVGDIMNIQAKYSIVLPAIYQEFLLRLGFSRDRGYEGTFSFLPELLDLTDEARQMITDSSCGFSLASDAFVFSMHGGYSFVFFYCGDGDDPRVWAYTEGNDDAADGYGTLSEYLRAALPVLLEDLAIWDTSCP